jgi:prepilin-type N-terminal cleavage/methylation domain-containing protein
MTISTPRTNRPRLPGRRVRRGRAGFTLVEVLVSATISAFIMAGILSALVMVGRSGYLSSSYSELANETRRALDTFGQDVRKAANIRWNSSQSVTLYVATSTNSTVTTTYAYDSVASSKTYQCFYRVLGEADSTEPRFVLMRNVDPSFAFSRYKLEQSGKEDNPAGSDLETKQLQLTMRASRVGAKVIAANQSSISARYILRNKRVSN